MKTTLTILALLLTTLSFGQYRTEKALLSVSLACVAKELVDSRFDNDDLIAGMGGAALASLSYTIDIEKLFKK